MNNNAKKTRLLMFVGITLALILLMSSFMGACSNTPSTTATTSASSQVPVKPITLVFSIQDPPGGKWDKQLYGPWFAELKALTGGRLKVEAHWSGELGAEQENIYGVSKQRFDMANILTTLAPDMFPMDDIASFVSKDVFCYRLSQVHQELFQEFPQMVDAYTKNNMKMLFKVTTYPSIIATTKGHPVRKLEDNKGLKVPATGKWVSNQDELLGHVPVSMPGSDVYQALQTGILDGHSLPLFVLWDFRWGEVFSYLTTVQTNSGDWACVINLDTWNSLPADIQKIILETSEANVDRWDTVMQQDYNQYLSAANKDFGIEVIDIAPEELTRWSKVCQQAWDAFAADLESKGLPGNKLIEVYKTLEKKYAASEYAPK